MATFKTTSNSIDSVSVQASRNAINVKEKITSSVSSQGNRLLREASKQAQQTDKDTRKVINATKTAISPAVTAGLAFVVAEAHKGYAMSLNDMSKTINNTALVNEAKKQGVEYNNHVRIRHDDQVSVKLDKKSGTDSNGVLLQNGIERANTINGTGRVQSAIIGYEDLYIHSTFKEKRNVIDQKTGEVKINKLTGRPVQESIYTINQRESSIHKFADNQLAAVREQLRESAKKGSLTIEQVEKVVEKNSFRYKRNGIESAHFTFDIDYSQVGKSTNINKIVKNTRVNMYSMNREAVNSANHLRLLSQEMAKKRNYSNNFAGKAERFLRTKGIINDLGDKDLNKFMKYTERAAKMQGKYQKLHSPKSLLRSGFRILTMPLQQSETVQGMGYLRAAGVGALGFMKMVKNPAFNIAQNSAVFVKKAFLAGRIACSNGAAKYGGGPKGVLKAYKRGIKLVNDVKYMNKFAKLKLNGKMPNLNYIGIKSLTRENPLIAGIRSWYNKQIVGALKRTAGRHFIGSNHNMFSNYIGNKIMNKAIGLENGLDKGAIKAMDKLVAKALRQQIANKVKETAAGKALSAGMKIAKKPFIAFSKTALGKGLGKGFKLLTSPFKKIIEGLKWFASKFSQFLSEVIAVIAKYMLIAIAVFVGFFIILQIFYMICLQFDSMFSWANRFTLSDAEEFTKRAEVFVDVLQECHSEQLAELKSIQESYETADIEYPSGEQENYKELWCALAVSTQYDPTILTTAEVKDIAKKYYKQTHRVTYKENEYTYKEADGTEKQATHIFLDIQRAEGLAYEELANIWDSAQASSTGYYNGASYAVATTVTNDDWMAVVKSLKAAIASTGVGYSQSSYVRITVNGEAKSVRQDCSGYVSACLQVYGSLDTSWSSHQFTDAGSIAGFTKYAWSGWSNLAAGDIISYHGHVEIFAYNLGNYHYVYSNGSTNSVRSAVPTTDSRSYVTVWRPNSAGSVDNVETNVESEELAAKDATKIADFEPTFSNTSDVVWNEDGNEDGYEDTLAADVNAEITSTTLFTETRYAAADTDHSLTDASHYSSTWDFVRYIFAKHGVAVPFENGVFGSQVSVGYHENLLKAGDIIWYAPHTYNFDALQAELESKDKNITNMGSAYRTAALNYDGTKEYASSYMADNVIPVIYLGNGTACAYSKDLTSSTYEGTRANVRIYNLTDLDDTRVYNTTRVRGFTVSPVFGYTTYFEGWTDDNISILMQLLYDECWTTGSKDISKAKIKDENGNSIDSVDYSWYKEDYFEGNDVYWSAAHTSTFENDLLKTLIAYYDYYGILPSVGYTTAYALSNNRSTGESLTYFNVWEQLEPNDSVADSEDKYSYDSNGDATVISRDFKKFASYEAAYADWADKLQSLGIDTTNYDFNTFAAQLAYLNLHAGITSGTKTEAQERYAEDSGTLSVADETAIKRKELIDKMTETAAKLASYDFSTNGVSENKNGTDRKRYYEACELLNQYHNEYAELKKIITDTDTATAKTDQLLRDYETYYNTYKAKAEGMYNYYITHKGSNDLPEYIENDAKDGKKQVTGTTSEGLPYQLWEPEHIPATYENWDKRSIPSL